MTNQMLGSYARRGDVLDIRFERNYPRPIETVWAALTEPERLSDWMGTTIVEPRVGGRFDTIQDSEAPMTGKVLVWQPPEVLEFTWSNKDAPDSVVRYELRRDGAAATRLVFMQRGVLPGRSSLMMPGWHWLFDRLANVFEGKAGTQSGKTWSEWQAIYVDRLKADLPDARLEMTV